MGHIDEVHEREGYIWPKSDRDCFPVVSKWMADMYTAINHCKLKRVAVQAGGNAGIWPKALSSVFDTVYTFEPDPLNFYCLTRNCTDDNVIKIQAALGYDRKLVNLHTERRNIGAHYIEGAGIIPTLRVDDLNLDVCDFLCLDIEGYEMQALLGAQETLSRHHPVIQLEDKGLSEKYGTHKEEVVDWLVSRYGYVVKHRVHRDVILT